MLLGNPQKQNLQKMSKERLKAVPNSLGLFLLLYLFIIVLCNWVF